MSESYYDIKKLKEVRETNKRLRKQFLRYQEAEIVYSIQHKKLLELASRAGAIYRIDGYVLINRDWMKQKHNVYYLILLYLKYRFCERYFF